MPAGNAYPSGHLIPSPFLGLACSPIVATRFLELAVFFLDFSPRLPFGTFSMLLRIVLSSFRDEKTQIYEKIKWHKLATIGYSKRKNSGEL